MVSFHAVTDKLVVCLLVPVLSFGVSLQVAAQSQVASPVPAVAVGTRSGDTMTYRLTISEAKVNITGKPVEAMLINGGLPGPTLRFKAGDYAHMLVTNTMDVETSVHWHGLIPPNLYDGVPYLTTPPIEPGETFEYKFRLEQDGTYWYHSHTGLQEQRGVLGALVIEPAEPPAAYDSDLVVVLSDWTNEMPEEQLRTLKRGNEWYAIKRGTTQAWNKVIARGAVGAKLNFAWQRMPDMQMSDNYFDAFLANGQREVAYPAYKPGERVRVRLVNAAAATYFWLTWGGPAPILFSSDGKDVVPIAHPKTLFGVSETYDFIVEVPASGRIELLATAMDGSGTASVFIGEGATMAAPQIPRPDLIGMMKDMTAMGMKMGAPSTKFRPSKDDSVQVMKEYAMNMDGMDGMEMGGMKGMKHGGMKHGGMKKEQGSGEGMEEMDHSKMDHSKTEETKMADAQMDHSKVDDAQMDHSKMSAMDSGTMAKEGMDGMHAKPMNPHADKALVEIPNMKPAGFMPGGNQAFNYDYLRAKEPTAFAKTAPVRNMLFNLTGNMYRYTWSINGVPVSETDKVMIQRGEVVRVTMNNLTMMHHPMHLHGHYFRVINANGEYSPLKHTVNVAPMQKVVIEFLANEYNDWFFHCHVLYHINSGMARVFSYGDERNDELNAYPIANLTTEANQLWTWGRLGVASNAARFYGTTTNLRNQFSVGAEVGYNQNLELEGSYERYLNDYVRVFGGVNVENEREEDWSALEPTAIAGVRVLLPLLIQSDFRIDSKLRPQVSFTGETMLFPRIMLEGEFEYQADFGMVERRDPEGLMRDDYTSETTWSLNVEYVLAKNWLVTGGYDNRWGWGGGVTRRL